MLHGRYWSMFDESCRALNHMDHAYGLWDRRTSFRTICTKHVVQTGGSWTYKEKSLKLDQQFKKPLIQKKVQKEVEAFVESIGTTKEVDQKDREENILSKEQCVKKEEKPEVSKPNPRQVRGTTPSSNLQSQQVNLNIQSRHPMVRRRGRQSNLWLWMKKKPSLMKPWRKWRPKLLKLPRSQRRSLLVKQDSVRNLKHLSLMRLWKKENLLLFLLWY